MRGLRRGKVGLVKGRSHPEPLAVRWMGCRSLRGELASLSEESLPQVEEFNQGVKLLSRRTHVDPRSFSQMDLHKAFSPEF